MPVPVFAFATLLLMIDLYTWATPNGRKVSIALEELEIEYRALPVNIGAGDQHKPEFRVHNPNGKIPVLVDHDEQRTLVESGAILLYLAEKTGRFDGGDNRWEMVQWLMFQMSAVGPIFGQTHHFNRYNSGVSVYAQERFVAETHRLYGVLDERFAHSEYLAGSYSMADIATFPWIARWPWHSVDWSEFPNLARWYRDLAARPAVQKGYNVPASDQRIELPDD